MLDVFRKCLLWSFECENRILKIPNSLGDIVKNTLQFFFYKNTFNVTFWLIENSTHDNFFYKITIGKLTKFATFGMFCKTERKITMYYKISTALLPVNKFDAHCQWVRSLPSPKTNRGRNLEISAQEDIVWKHV